MRNRESNCPLTSGAKIGRLGNPPQPHQGVHNGLHLHREHKTLLLCVRLLIVDMDRHEQSGHALPATLTGRNQSMLAYLAQMCDAFEESGNSSYLHCLLRLVMLFKKKSNKSITRG